MKIITAHALVESSWVRISYTLASENDISLMHGATGVGSDCIGGRVKSLVVKVELKYSLNIVAL